MKKRKGFVELLFLLFVLVIALKIFIVYRAWCMIEEKSRHDMGLPPKATPTEVISEQFNKLQSKSERDEYERLKKKFEPER